MQFLSSLFCGLHSLHLLLVQFDFRYLLDSIKRDLYTDNYKILISCRHSLFSFLCAPTILICCYDWVVILFTSPREKRIALVSVDENMICVFSTHVCIISAWILFEHQPSFIFLHILLYCRRIDKFGSRLLRIKNMRSFRYGEVVSFYGKLFNKNTFKMLLW